MDEDEPAKQQEHSTKEHRGAKTHPFCPAQTPDVRSDLRGPASLENPVKDPQTERSYALRQHRIENTVPRL